MDRAWHGPQPSLYSSLTLPRGPKTEERELLKVIGGVAKIMLRCENLGRAFRDAACWQRLSTRLRLAYRISSVYQRAGKELEAIQAASMRREWTKQNFRLRLLAFVLALAIVWYSLNPAPRPISRKKRVAGPPDEKKQNLEPQAMPATSLLSFKPAGETFEAGPSPMEEDDDDFEWPEFIDG